MEPTEQELKTAIRIVKVFFDTPQRARALKDLQCLRDRKKTWIGAEECALRVELDRFIREGGSGFDV